MGPDPVAVGPDLRLVRVGPDQRSQRCAGPPHGHGRPAGHRLWASGAWLDTHVAGGGPACSPLHAGAERSRLLAATLLALDPRWLAVALGYVKEMKEVGSGEGKTHGGSAGDSAEVAAPPPEKARAKLWAGKKAAAQPGKRSRKCGRCAPVFLTSLPVPLQELCPSKASVQYSDRPAQKQNKSLLVSTSPEVSPGVPNEVLGAGLPSAPLLLQPSCITSGTSGSLLRSVSVPKQPSCTTIGTPSAWFQRNPRALRTPQTHTMQVGRLQQALLMALLTFALNSTFGPGQLLSPGSF